MAPRLTEVPQFSLGSQKIYLVAQCKEPRVLKIKGFLERINAEETQELGTLQAMQENLFESQEFSPSHAGRYKIIFEVLDEAKQSTLFFQKEVFFR